MKPSLLRDLRKKSYEEIEHALKQVSTPTILCALDDSSNKIGDTAAEVLVARKAYDDVRKALLDNALKTAKGRLRASHVLKRQGSRCKANVRVYEHLLKDRSEGVVSNALFGLVFFPSPGSLPHIREIASELTSDSQRKAMFDRAIAAIEEEDSSIYSPGFTDVADVWKAASSKKQ